MNNCWKSFVCNNGAYNGNYHRTVKIEYDDEEFKYPENYNIFSVHAFSWN